MQDMYNKFSKQQEYTPTQMNRLQTFMSGLSDEAKVHIKSDADYQTSKGIMYEQLIEYILLNSEIGNYFLHSEQGRISSERMMSIAEEVNKEFIPESKVVKLENEELKTQLAKMQKQIDELSTAKHTKSEGDAKK